MSAFRVLMLSLPCLALAACAMPEPVAVVGSNALSMRGTVTLIRPTTAKLEVTDGKLSCSGAHKGFFTGAAVLNVTCSDGRKGVAEVDNDSTNRVRGHLHLEDGTDAEIVASLGS